MLNLDHQRMLIMKKKWYSFTFNNGYLLLGIVYEKSVKG